MNWDEWATADLEQAYENIADTLRRRRLLASAPEQAEALARSVLAAQGLREGDPWRPPTGPHDAYPAGWVASHDGATYRSQLPGNMEQPSPPAAGALARRQSAGVPAWEVVDEGNLIDE